jgi:GNAT superfamily N-acetyltransferase
MSTSKKKSQFIVRPAQKRDLDACLQLNHALDTSHVWQMQRREGADLTSISFQSVRLPRPIRVEYPRAANELRGDLADIDNVLVAEAEGVLLGYTQITVMQSDMSAWLRNIIVDEPWRRHRIGRALFDQAKQLARVRGANHITAETSTKSYPAIQFMLSRGLLFCGFNDRYYASQDIALFFGQNL